MSAFPVMLAQEIAIREECKSCGHERISHDNDKTCNWFMYERTSYGGQRHSCECKKFKS
jgi:hypothetical protein